MDIFCDAKYLVLPVNRNALTKKLEFFRDKSLVFDLDIKLDFKNPEQHYYLDVSRFSGVVLKLKCVQFDLPDIKKADELPQDKSLYAEVYRPFFHFTAGNGWINDPNGLFFYKGKYHMFYQYNPVGTEWGNMHWGHAVSCDLLHWEEKDIALFPDDFGTMFSGSAIVDKYNIAGLKDSIHDPILLYYTAAGGTSSLSKDKPFVQCLAVSSDGGETFEKYDKNPLIENLEEGNRDPKVEYHPESGSYVMALYMTGNEFALFCSANLIDWELKQKISLGDDWECPDFYPLPVEDTSDCVKWILSGASDRYIVGSFDGNEFRPETNVRKLQYSDKSYAAQTWSNTADSDGRRIRISWNRFPIPGMNFNNSMTFPCKMSLKSHSGELFLCAYPIEDIHKLYKNCYKESNIKINAQSEYSKTLQRTAYDINLLIKNVGVSIFCISIFGLDIYSDFDKNEINCSRYTAPLFSDHEELELRLLIDVNATEIFINKGMATMCIGHLQDYNVDKFVIRTGDSEIQLKSIAIAELNKIW